MCWNSSSSLGFFIGGTLLTTIILSLATIQQKWYLVAFCLGWYWVLGMQLAEYFLWTHSKDFNAGYAAFFLNIMQIPIVYLVFASVSPNYQVPTWSLSLASLVLLAYLSGIAWMGKDLSRQDFMVNSTHQSHLRYPWWDKMKFGGMLYLLSLIALFLLLARPLSWTLWTIATIVAFFMVSYIFYRPYLASMWCFLVVIMPLFAFGYSMIPQTF